MSALTPSLRGSHAFGHFGPRSGPCRHPKRSQVPAVGPHKQPRRSLHFFFAVSTSMPLASMNRSSVNSSEKLAGGTEGMLSANAHRTVSFLSMTFALFHS